MHRPPLPSGPVLVTGATGFVGKHLVDRLVGEGYSVRVLARDAQRAATLNPAVAIVVGDVRNPQAVAAAVGRSATVFHLAAKVHDLAERGDSGEHRAVTVLGTENVIRAARDAGTQALVFMSSLSVYSGAAMGRHGEDPALAPASAYGQAKLAAERIVLDFGASSGAHVCCLRPACTYGIGWKGNLPRMLRLIERGWFPPLPVTTGRRSLAYVADIVEAALLAASVPAANGQRYVVTDDECYSPRGLYEMMCAALNQQVPRWHVPLPTLQALAAAGDVLGWARGRRAPFDSAALDKIIGSEWYPSDRISTDLGFRATTTLQRVLPAIIEWSRRFAPFANGRVGIGGNVSQ